MAGWFGYKDPPVYKWYQVPNISDKRGVGVEIQLIETKIPEGINKDSIPYSAYYTYNAKSSPDMDLPTFNNKIQDGMTVHFNWKYNWDHVTHVGQMQWHKPPNFNETGYWTASLDGSQKFDAVVYGHSTLLDIMHMVFFRYFNLNSNPTADVPGLIPEPDGGSSRRKKTKKRRTKRTIKRRKTKRK
jgi:hypothetical protein